MESILNIVTGMSSKESIRRKARWTRITVRHNAFDIADVGNARFQPNKLYVLHDLAISP